MFAELLENSSRKSQQQQQQQRTSTSRPQSRAGTGRQQPQQRNPSAQSQNAYDLAASAVRRAARSPSRREEQRQQQILDLQRAAERRDLESQLPRRYSVGDVVSPHDLSGVEANKWKKLQKRPKPNSKGSDIIDMVGINPLDHYKNFSIMSEYMTEMGKIKHSSETGLRPVNQRRMAKAIRRAIGIGMMPSTYRHPEIIRLEIEKRNSRGPL
ncbi:ribosomal protein S18 [Polychaeton citri CBS 116435]|uniref:Small ribosomal subunit protein bS18m n=1 Tax=Polychaeton citri CBS 116435 TaxID=1314669 RepID=A0A9P4Q7Q8_9PEZI|nr:ribosomal protein S18 [Polychaeton citri CBS 116435]